LQTKNGFSNSGEINSHWKGHADAMDGVVSQLSLWNRI